MRLEDNLKHPLDHAGLSNVTIDQHHDQPENIEISNTTLSVEPAPGGPGTLDISMPSGANVVKFSLRSNRTVAEGYGKAGVHGIANRDQFDTTTFSLGGDTSIAITSYNACYTKVASHINLSHKVFSSVGDDIALSDAYLVANQWTVVLRLVFTNYGASTKTLNCWGEVQVIG